MELRREHRKLSLAIVVVLDRSGSMAMRTPDGRLKMELADLATAEVLNMLGPADQFGCIAVDSTPHEIVPLADCANKESMRQKVLKIDSAGGGIFIYEALVAAARMIAPAKAGTRHIILFADASDSEHPEDWVKVVDACRKAGITISVVGLGTEKDCDAALLKDIGRRGGGQCMFTEVAQELPRLFAQDTCVVARSAFIEELTGVRPAGGMVSITQQALTKFPQVGGYNLCYLRPTANLALVSQDEYQAPILASWQAKPCSALRPGPCREAVRRSQRRGSERRKKRLQFRRERLCAASRLRPKRPKYRLNPRRPNQPPKRDLSKRAWTAPWAKPSSVLANERGGIDYSSVTSLS